MTRSVLVTGGNRGIGREIAQSFAKAGHRVAITYRSEPPPEDFLAVRADITAPDDVEQLFRRIEEEHGPVEVLVANAGITRDKLLPRLSDDDFSDVLETNLTGSFRVARRAARKMFSARWGRIIFVSSIVGFTGAPGQINYSASKSGLTGLTRSLAWELGSRGITANLVAPGLIETEMTAELTTSRREEVLRMTAMRRTGSPDEVAGVVEFLASDAASFITGAAIPVSGGFGMGY
ncbi:3-oxoacyl-ACP reductase FabG [Saccharopolyspora sp. ASAGF58]|uniref:3-oxoacyl-ACP reductase FabG n=1 Tax=Saccharopolyspora sp. ASAGF58 TaxID=2719023 RepID=UPI00143FCDA8|nr:3-oxoacyl-ACP reductase FabG [Saccharopolyspora sp. ASAGF58]QIZ37342.1 SDR family oxidoreductase [Saccharopolyspora sp. ASAGF58]